jgi:hypothetical protein
LYHTNTAATLILLAESQKHFTKLDKTDYLKLAKLDDLKHLLQVRAEYGKMSANTLMKHTYINYPFYATKSEVAGDILDKHELEKVKAAEPNGTKTVLFTIGYEGISLEE